MEKQKAFSLEQKISQLAVERLETQVVDSLAVTKQAFHQVMDQPSCFPDMTISEAIDAIGKLIVVLRRPDVVEQAVDQALEQLGYQLGYTSRAVPPMASVPSAAPWHN